MKYKSLHDVCDFISGLWTGKKPPYIKVNVIRNTNFHKSGNLDFENVAELDVEIKQFNTRQLKFGDIILEKSGGGPNQPVGRVCLFEKKNEKFSLSNFTCALRVKNLYMSGETEKIQTNSTGIRNLQIKLYKDYKLFIEPLPIQVKIVAKLDLIFAEIDKAIAATEANIKNTQDFFQSYLEKIYNNVDFEKKKISEVAKIKGGKRIPKGFNLKTEKTPYVYLRVKSFNESGEIDNSELRYVDAEVKNLIKNYIINSEDLYISIAGTIGRTGIVSKELSGSLLTENACRLVFEKNINNKFVYYFTKSPSFKSQLLEQTRTTAQPKLALYRLGNIKLIIPNLKQQFMIVEDVERITFFVTSNQNKYFSKINELKNLKQSILQQAFNGELVKAA